MITADQVVAAVFVLLAFNAVAMFGTIAYQVGRWHQRRRLRRRIEDLVE